VLEFTGPIEKAEVALAHSFVETSRRVDGERPRAQRSISETTTAFFEGVVSPLSRVVGLGLDAPVNANDVDEITDFYLQRGAAARIWENPASNASLREELTRAQYAPVLYQNVLAVDLSQHGGRRDPRVEELRDLETWADASASAFVGDDLEFRNEQFAFAKVVASTPGITALAAFSENELAATSALAIRGEFASLLLGSTLPRYRRLGLHNALVMDRMARAREARARYAYALAGIGSASERNFSRCGFAVLYTRTLWEKRA